MSQPRTTALQRWLVHVGCRWPSTVLALAAAAIAGWRGEKT